MNPQSQGMVGVGVGKRWQIAVQPPAHGGRPSTWFSRGLLWDADFTAHNRDASGTPTQSLSPSCLILPPASMALAA